MSLKEIKVRMQAIEKTASITFAMHNIALSKIKKSTELLKHSNRFLEHIKDVIVHANQNLENGDRYTAKSEGKKFLYVLITSDRGLAGSYHNQLFKAFLDEVKDLNKDDYQVFVIGRKGFFFVEKNHLPRVNDQIISNRDDISTLYFRNYASLMKEVFTEGYVDEIIIFHNHYINTGTQQVYKETILPIALDEKQTITNDYIYDEDPQVVLDKTMNVYLESRIFEAIADAKLSEQASRMIAMKNATDNANEIVSQLNLLYHRERQREITNEIIDVINGANV
ncbi:MAG: ATP synthase F1 subunit gamma [Acholeplasmataceae bacterium]|nr:ATP synthase F1 subunit gamma [Acholeplasmataceae bacterium]